MSSLTARPIMVQGTTSNAGKSLLTAGLCRIFWQDGHTVAPFKSQNMALNSFITPEGLEIGRAQAMQAECCCIPPTVSMNPILLKPTNDVGSQVIVNGKPVGNMPASTYFAYKKNLVPTIQEAYHTLAKNHEIIVIEGAGSPAEINLKQDDIVNMGLAKMVSSPVLLCGDIDRGGVFASLYGTIALLEPEERAMVRGFLINKFRGDLEILKPGLKMLENLTGIPVLGVVPYLDLQIDEEDSLSQQLVARGTPSLIDIAVIRLPRISNFTDLNPLSVQPGVSVRYICRPSELKNPDLIILPGSKNTMGDLLWMRQNGLEAAVKKYASVGGAVFGICGGYQMLGLSIADPEQVESGGEIAGIGLLPMRTVFSKEKRTTQVTGRFLPVEGVLSPLSGLPVAGYEIHMGQSEGDAVPLTRATDGVFDGAQVGNVYGSYLHGIFDTEEAAGALVNALLLAKGLSGEDRVSIDYESFKQAQYDLLARSLRESLDLKRIYEILEAGV